MLMNFLRDEAAAAQVVAFLAAGAIFVAATGGLLAWTYLSADDAPRVEQAAQDVDADALLDLLVASQGAGWANPDTLQRLGLANANGSLDGAHVALLNRAGLTAQPNGLVDYDEAHAAFGLPTGGGFHLRLTPLSFEEALQDYDLTHHKALYIGDWASIASITLPLNNATIANANAQLNLSMAAATLWEREVLRQVGVEFDNQVHLTLTTPTVLVQITTIPNVKIPLLTHLALPLWDGDVLFDNKQYLDSVLPGKLANGGYDLIVVGAGIDHNTLTSNAVKGSIEDFVRDGGTLMVFGASGGNYNWMQPIFDVSATTTSGPVQAPDAGHDVLDTPWTLKWPAYDSQGLAWTLGQPSAFDHALVQGGKPVLAISKPGTVDDGMVFLSTFKASTIGNALGAQEAQNLMFNMLLYRFVPDVDADGFVFGPPAPTGQPVSSATRVVGWDVPGLGVVPVRADLLAWGTP